MSTTLFYLEHIVGTISFYLPILSQAWTLLWFNKKQKSIMKTSIVKMQEMPEQRTALFPGWWYYFLCVCVLLITF